MNDVADIIRAICDLLSEERFDRTFGGAYIWLGELSADEATRAEACRTLRTTGYLVPSRCDLVQAEDAQVVAASETCDTGATFHRVEVTWNGVDAARKRAMSAGDVPALVALDNLLDEIEYAL